MERIGRLRPWWPVWKAPTEHLCLDPLCPYPFCPCRHRFGLVLHQLLQLMTVQRAKTLNPDFNCSRMCRSEGHAMRFMRGNYSAPSAKLIDAELRSGQTRLRWCALEG